MGGFATEDKDHQSTRPPKSAANEDLPSRAFLIPAYNPGELLYQVASDLKRQIDEKGVTAPIVVVNDGCTDCSFSDEAVARHLPGVTILSHDANRGKGAALRTGLLWARDHGISELVSLDADGQHPAGEAMHLLLHGSEAGHLLLAVRDLPAAGAPISSQRSNAFSNLVLSWMAGKKLLDTQCGLRRYPTAESLALGTKAHGYAFESDIVLRAARRGMPIEHIPCEVFYPDEKDRVSYFDSVRDPAKIIFTVVATTLFTAHHSALRRAIWWLFITGAALLTFDYCTRP